MTLMCLSLSRTGPVNLISDSLTDQEDPSTIAQPPDSNHRFLWFTMHIRYLSTETTRAQSLTQDLLGAAAQGVHLLQPKLELGP